MIAHKKTLIGGVALIAVTNLIALLGVAYNRSGEPEAVVELTERELRMPYRYGMEKEDSGLALELEWRVSGEREYYFDDRWSSLPWLDQAKLADLGFEVSEAPDNDEVRRYYHKMLPRKAYIVLEYDGPAYQALIHQRMAHLREEQALQRKNPDKKEFAERVENAQEQLQQVQQSMTRLMAIDAGHDRALLRRSYPDTSHYLIVEGEIELQVASRDEKSYLTGYIRGLSINNVHVPLRQRAVFDGLKPDERRPFQSALPRYAVRVAWGKRAEPWLLTVRPLPVQEATGHPR